MWNFFWSNFLESLEWRLLIGQDFAELIIFQRANFEEIFYYTLHEHSRGETASKQCTSERVDFKIAEFS